MLNIVEIFKKNILELILTVFSLASLSLSIYNFVNTYDNDVKKENLLIANKPLEEVAIEEKEEKLIHVDIKGAVKNPGVYQVEENTILQDVITSAGGFNSNAYQNNLNLSKKVNDEMVIYVYTKTEIAQDKAKETETVSNATSCEVPSYTITECTENKESIIESSDSNVNINNNTTNDSADKKLVNINTASIEELTTISGIGNSKAEAIIAYRNESGLFKNITDILNVSGIGEALFEKIKDFITI